MLPNDRAQPAAADKPDLGTRVWRAYRQLPIWLRVVVAIVAIPFFEVFLDGNRDVVIVAISGKEPTEPWQSTPPRLWLLRQARA